MSEPHVLPVRAAKNRLLRPLRIAGELLAMVAVLFALDRLVGQANGFATLSVNPYWLPVLVMAVAYGCWAGLAAVVVTSAVWLLSLESSTAPGGDYFAHVFDLSLPPLLWYIAAAVIGEVTDLRMRRIDYFRKANQRARRNMGRLVGAFQQLTGNNRAMQLRIAAEERTVSAALALAARLPHVTGRDRQAVLRDMIAMGCHTEDFTCYRLQGAHVWPVLFGGESRRDHSPLSETLLDAIRNRRDIVHAARPGDRQLLSDLGLVAIPLPCGTTQPLEGMLVIHNLPLTAVGPHLTAELASLAAWLTPYMADNSLLGDMAAVRERTC